MTLKSILKKESSKHLVIPLIFCSIILCISVNCTIIIVQDAKACFRRALAGKRVAPQWIRRTLSCERMEDCQAECGLEKRFSCEGFNYRLDPTGQGQGICELIDIPLADIDIYSSPSRRDENLLYHPDYDYYERDRNACRPSLCKDCSSSGVKSFLNEPSSGYDDMSHNTNNGNEHSTHKGGKNYKQYSMTSDYNTNPTTYRPIENYKPFSDSRPHHQSSDRFQPPLVNTAIDKYRPPYDFVSDEHRPSPHPDDNYDYNRYDISNQFSSSVYRAPTYDLDRYDFVKPPIRHHPPYSDTTVYRPPPFSQSSSFPSDEYYHHRQPPEFSGSYRTEDDSSYPTFSYRLRKPELDPSQSYLNRNRDRGSQKIYNLPKPTQSQPYVPYSINTEPSSWASYGGSYGGSNHYNQQSNNFWGLSNNFKPNDVHFDYFNLGRAHKYDRNENSVLSYPGSRYDQEKHYEHVKNRNYYGSLWTRRPGQDDCSVKSSEGFRLHKTVVRYVYNVPTVNECEQMCHSESKFRCMTYSYKYTSQTRDNCLLCDRPISHLDYYTDIEPNLDYDIYSMSDDLHMCNQVSSSHLYENKNTQCFFRAIDLNRFFKSIVRDSLTVRTVAECEMECIKTIKFTCRAFSFRYSPKATGSIIDNCQLSDWPVIDMDKDQHLVHDTAFDVYERASYGHGCEIHPITDDKHEKLCYLGYGSPAKLLSSAIKKVVSVSTEFECKNECIRFRENTSFKCYSFSYGSKASTYNCEMSDMDQSKLKLNIHYTHTNDRDYWLFAWNPFDLTCRDKVATIGGSNRMNNDRRMDIFRGKDGDSTWTHFTVSGKACRVGSACNRNLINNFYSCEIDGDEVGSWDYCCKSDYPCGYSQGFDYPWCFVGDAPDQWRTCSERYYPLTPSASNSSSNQISSTGTNSTKRRKISPNSYTTNKRKGGNSISDSYHQQPPRPGGLQNLEDIASARLWPVTYLYSSGPPNSTDLSNFVDCNKETC